MQSLFIGLGAVIASALPFHADELAACRSGRRGPYHSSTGPVLVLCRSGGLLGRSAVDHFHHQGISAAGSAGVSKAKAEAKGLAANAREIFQSIGAMPATMRQLALVQICTWLGLFCMWLYFPVAVAHNVFGAPR